MPLLLIVSLLVKLEEVKSVVFVARRQRHFQRAFKRPATIVASRRNMICFDHAFLKGGGLLYYSLADFIKLLVVHLVICGGGGVFIYPMPFYSFSLVFI